MPIVEEVTLQCDIRTQASYLSHIAYRFSKMKSVSTRGSAASALLKANLLLQHSTTTISICKRTGAHPETEI